MKSQVSPAQTEAGVAEGRGRLRVCLAASGGGHLRQLLDLEPVWAPHDYFFITEDTALGQTMAKNHRTEFLPHFAWGQAKMGAPFRMLARAAVSAVHALRVMLRERPDLVISTGAGAVIFPVFWGRLLGARIVVVESFARFDHPSLFGRIAAPFAHDLVVQSAKLADRYPRAHVFDPLRILDAPVTKKEELLFATVGATLPFNRLVDSVATLKASGDITENILMQTGVGGNTPAGLDVVETIPFDEVQSILKRAKIVVCHGGTGSLITALREGCQVIAMPRLSARGEHYDDHQAEITEAFAARGLVLVANSVDELRAAVITARQRPPVRATTEPAALIGFLKDITARLRPRRR
jgi:UDP-N-acetylglucosamine--N-acetylmuramyl-(pentapeptide) pyrophosphoryl-undecaprenol N-acetylglucosamine transferase